jgi:dsDNA-binding SOS-regulon protein
MLNELKPIFEQIDASLFTEDTLAKISTLIEEKVKERSDAQIELAVEAAISSFDEDVTKKTQHLIETFKANIDQDHTAKIKFVVEKLNADHMEKLLTLKEKYDNLLKETAVGHKEQLVESVDRFFEKYIDKAIPRSQILEAAKNQHVQQLLEQVREVAGVDTRYIKENVKKGILDGKKQLDRVLKENAELKHERNAEKARRFLVEKTRNLPVDTAKFVRARLESKPFEYIKENFNFVVDLYSKEETKERRSVQRKQSPTTIVESAPVYQRLVNEHTSDENPLTSLYMEGLKKISR